MGTRRDAAKGGLAIAALSLAGCATSFRRSSVIDPQANYRRKPRMMAIGDSMYQGVRSLTFAPNMPQGSPPALVARALNITPFIIPDPSYHMLFDLERIISGPLPAVTYAATIWLDVWNNYYVWSNARTPWSRHEAFDNVAIGSADISDLYTDTYATHFPRLIESSRRRLHEFLPYGAILDMWYALNVCYTLNPLHRDEQVNKSQLCQVRDRRPEILLVNIGSNEGLFNAAFMGKVAFETDDCNIYLAKITELARRLKDLPRETEKIVFNSLIQPRTAPNLMPHPKEAGRFPRDRYFDAYGPSLFTAETDIPGAALEGFDRYTQEKNQAAKAILENIVGPRLVFADLYAASSRHDGKHYSDRSLRIGNQELRNTPIRAQEGRLRQGGLAGLDNMHPTVPGYALVADTVLAALNSRAIIDKAHAMSLDGFLTKLPTYLDAQIGAVGAASDFIADMGVSLFGSKSPTMTPFPANASCSAPPQPNLGLRPRRR